MATTTKSTTSDKSENGSRKKQSTDSSKQKATANAAKDLAEVFEHGLKDIYWAEKALLKALPKMEKNATAEKLKKAISKHLLETENHVKRLEQCFESLELKPKAERCAAMAGLIEEGEQIIEDTEEGTVRDAGIIAAAQKIEHYEIATYGTLAAFAKVLKYNAVIQLLRETLEEEKKCDSDLTSLADTNLNAKAR
ncbi:MULTISPECIES: ferritin-like domain-containing protein [unclassified Sphingobacterium]|uniref:YciE/YciF ferroxidase family protein n=1 Tax=unclassified Sphingobacterium TaxID=2609468 RepID=UPI0025E0445C|nr:MULTISPECIES: ferritin-like domain-containing protein [unclassified Sphingobacterium]